MAECKTNTNTKVDKYAQGAGEREKRGTQDNGRGKERIKAKKCGWKVRSAGKEWWKTGMVKDKNGGMREESRGRGKER